MVSRRHWLYRGLIQLLKRFHLGWGLFTRFPWLKNIYLYLLHAFKPTGILLLKVQGNKLYVDTRDEGVSRLLIEDGIIEPAITHLFRSILKEGMTVVDIGANLGYYTLLSARLVGKHGKVYAFEPVPHNFKLLEKSIAANRFTNITAIEKAVSDKQGKTRIYIDAGNFGNHTLVYGTTHAVHGAIEIETISLDEFFNDDEKIDLIKMDAEGAEGLIIEGGRKILARKNIRIIMEFWPLGQEKLGFQPYDLLHRLRQYGFSIKLITEKPGYLRQASDNEIITLFNQTGISPNLYLEKLSSQ